MTAPTPYRLPSRTPIRVTALAIVAALVVFGYCVGTRHGARGTTVAAIAAHRDTVLDTIRVVERRLRVDTIRVRVTADGAQKRRAAFDSAAHAVEAVADTSASVPANLAMPAVHACEAALAAQDTARAAVLVELADMTVDRDAQQRRAEDDEREMKVFKPPRFGFKSGLVTGIAIVAAVVRFVR